MTDQVSYGPPTTGAAGTGYAGSGRASGPRAGFWRRFAAALIDGIIVLVVLGVLSAIVKGAGYGIGLLLSIAYFVYFEGGETGQTPGKRALGIRVVDFSTGGPIGYGRAFVRWIGRIISSAVVYLGYLWMLWDREKQTWHDKLANDVVVPVSDYPVTR
jgi:uncharacterized RDD family membrane protein YckC